MAMAETASSTGPAGDRNESSPLGEESKRNENRDEGSQWRGLGSCEGFDLRTWIPEGSEAGRSEGFRRFPDLPYELRIKIWRAHLERPRIVIVRGLAPGSGVDVAGNDLGNLVSNVRWYSQNRSPAAFRVCCESRVEALSFFRVRLPVDNAELDRYGYPEAKHRNPVWDHIYVNPDWDMVIYHGTSRSVTMPMLASDLLASDPQGQGVVHFGSNDWPKSIWAVDPSPGEGMATLAESLACLRSYAMCMRPMSDVPERLDEGYVAAVGGHVGARGIAALGTRPDGDEHPMNNMIRRALGLKGVSRAATDGLVTIEMTSRVRPTSHAGLPPPPTDGWLLQLTWQPPGHAASAVMYIATG